MGNPTPPPSTTIATIPDLPTAGALSGAELLWINQTGLDRSVTAGAVAALGGAGKYLPLTGGSLSGSLSVSGALTVGGSASGTTPNAGDNSAAFATTAFVQNAISSVSGVSSWNGRTGPVTLTLADVTGVGGAAASQFANYLPLAGGAISGALSVGGGLTATTRAPGDSTTNVATTAFVATAIANQPPGVSAFNTRTGAVSLTQGDVSAVAVGSFDGRTGAVALTQADIIGVGALNDVGRNYIHNPIFGVQQRGQGPWTVNTNYTADRWAIAINNGTISVTAIALADADRASIGDETARACLSVAFTGTSGTTDYTAIIQKMENVRRLGNKTVTLSFWARAAAAVKLGASIDQNPGTGGSPSGYVSGSGQSVNLTTAWARYTLTYTIPSTAGFTLGTNGDDNTQLGFWFSGGSGVNSRTGSVGVQSGTVFIWGVQVEIGSVATPLAKRDPADDFRLCQRFYWNGSYGFQGYGGAGYNNQVTVTFPVTMRATPTIVNNVGSSSNVTLGSSSLLSHTYAVDVTALSTALGPFYYIGTFTASADL